MFSPVCCGFIMSHCFFIGRCHGQKVHVPRNSYVAALTPSVAVSGDGASKEVTEANEVIRAGPWFSRISVLVRRHDGELELGKDHVRTRQGGCCLQAGKRVLTCSQSAGSLVPGFQPPGP